LFAPFTFFGIHNPSASTSLDSNFGQFLNICEKALEAPVVDVGFEVSPTKENRDGSFSKFEHP
jgi:hypothetical protein